MYAGRFNFCSVPEPSGTELRGLVLKEESPTLQRSFFRSPAWIIFLPIPGESSSAFGYELVNNAIPCCYTLFI